jgi:Lipase (class 3)
VGKTTSPERVDTGRAAAPARRGAAAGRAGSPERLSLLEYERKLRDELDVGGLWVRDTRGPSREQLRPYGPRDTPGFPVYPDLESHLLAAEEHPDPVIAHVLATCAAYSYSDAGTLATIMARMGLIENHCRMVATSVDGMFIRSTAFLIQSNSGRVAILSYRGTEPANSINWLTDADVVPERMGYGFGDPCATVHAGFYRNVRATRHEVMWALKRACNGGSVRRPLPDEPDGARPAKPAAKLEALYITGHSLGGAMAALMGVMLKHERKYRSPDDNIAELLKAVYTFGQPMIGDTSFAKACQRNLFLREKVIRYVYDSDVVPHLPPRTAGSFRHFGREWAYRIPHLRHGVLGAGRYLGPAYDIRSGEWREQRKSAGQALSALGGVGLAVMAFVADKIQPLRSLPVLYSFEDHRPNHYIAALTPYGVANEFGD